MHLRDRLLTLTNLENLVPPKPLISGLIYQNTAAQISPARAVTESFIAVRHDVLPGHGYAVLRL